MVMSMTAFARNSRDTAWGRLTLELRSVNHRYLEFSTRLPDELRSIENDLREHLRHYVKRGKLDCTVSLRATSGSESMMPLDNEALQRLLAAVDAVAAASTYAVILNPLEVLRWPGLLQTPESEFEALQRTVSAAFVELLTELAASRAREGVNLRQFLLQRCHAMSDEVRKLQQQLPAIEKMFRERLTNRLDEITRQIDHDRLEQELVYMAQKMDVCEELDRVSSHLGEVERLLDSDGPVGRRLDFLMQELNREANTLSSKSIDKSMTRSAVEMKVLIEQMREQIQNIE